MVKLSDILKLGLQRNIYTQFAKNYCGINLTKKRINGIQAIYIKDVEAYTIYEKCANHYKRKKETLFVASIVKDFFDNLEKNC